MDFTPDLIRGCWNGENELDSRLRGNDLRVVSSELLRRESDDLIEVFGISQEHHQPVNS